LPNSSQPSVSADDQVLLPW